MDITTRLHPCYMHPCNQFVVDVVFLSYTCNFESQLKVGTAINLDKSGYAGSGFLSQACCEAPDAGRTANGTEYPK